MLLGCFSTIGTGNLFHMDGIILKNIYSDLGPKHKKNFGFNISGPSNKTLAQNMLMFAKK